jgi:hypothetical protein
MVKIFLKIKKGAGGCASERERSQYQIVLSISLGYFFFHFLYYLMWFGRQIEAVTLEKTKFRQLLGLHVWYIARPLFSCINLGKNNNLMLCYYAHFTRPSEALEIWGANEIGSTSNYVCDGVAWYHGGSIVLASTASTQTR